MDGVVIDLVGVGTAARPLAEWWDRLCATGDADVAALDAARKQLADLCELPGRVGQAIRLIVYGPIDAPPIDLTIAVELVAATARRCPTSMAPNAGRPRRPRRGQPRVPDRDGNQLALPGFEVELPLA